VPTSRLEVWISSAVTPLAFQRGQHRLDLLGVGVEGLAHAGVLGLDADAERHGVGLRAQRAEPLTLRVLPVFDVQGSAEAGAPAKRRPRAARPEERRYAS
jgi:hypothetical protein